VAHDQPPGTPSRHERLAALFLRRSALDAGEAALLREEFGEIFHTHRRKVMAQIRLRVADPATAADLLQDVFVALHAHVLANGFPDNLPAYLYASTRGRLSNLARAHRRSPISVGLPSSGSEPPRTGPDAERRLDLLALAPQLLEQLSDEHRELVERMILQGEAHAEVAAELRIPKATLKSRLMAAKQRLYELVLPLLPPSQRRA
jgi:RNA polymerase sigma-70 factor (ECF subfamily)